MTVRKKERCHFCKRVLDNPDDPFSEDCGGDCLQCMADIAEDPDAVARVKILREAKHA
jgi:rRNA maturation endonuclease Nob1